MMLGLGTMYKTDSNGNVIDCDLFSNFFQPACWNPFDSTVVPATGGNSGSTAVPATPAPGACGQSLIPGVCDSLIYLGGAAFVALMVVPMLGRR